MYSIIGQWITPKYCYQRIKAVQPWTLVIAIIFIICGSIEGFYFAPADYRQGEVYRIIYIHVPAAICAMIVYLTMAISALIYLTSKIKIADMLAKVCAPIGVNFVIITLISGSIWGKQTWGAWWVWDARLTSELILLFIYFGIIVLRAALPIAEMSAKACSVLILIGAVDLPIIHFSVKWWQTLHQGATLFKLGKPSIDPTMLWPLLIMICGFIFLSLWLLITSLQIEIVRREKNCHWLHQILINKPS